MRQGARQTAKRVRGTISFQAGDSFREGEGTSVGGKKKPQGQVKIKKLCRLLRLKGQIVSQGSIASRIGKVLEKGRKCPRS